jgi:hypothetical protein
VLAASLPSICLGTQWPSSELRAACWLASAIAAIWRRILAAEAVDRNANFFEIGGNSILAMKFVSKVTLRLGVQVSLRAVVMDTLSQIAAYCDQESRSEVPEKSDGGLQRLFARVFGS